MGNLFLAFVVALAVGAAAIAAGCWRCGGPFELLVHVVDFVLDHR